jgi:putative oxidoreductase
VRPSSRCMEVGMLVLRVVVGVIVAGHGAQKLFGWFGGGGVGATGGMFETVGLRPGRMMAVGAGVAELAGGLLFAAGLLTPLAATLIITVMGAAIFSVHWRSGLWVIDGGYEYNLVLIAIAFAVTATGPGERSLDDVLGLDLAGLGWALAALGAGLAGALAARALGRAAAHAPAGPRPAGA